MPDGDDPPGGTEKRKTPNRTSQADQDQDFFRTYVKNGYKRVFAENAVSAEYCVFVESCKEHEKLGNNNPIVTTNLFKNEVKGITNIKRVNPNKICVTFSQANNANNFLKNEEFLSKHKFKAFIPAAAVETTGVLRYVPTSISNEELFKKLSSPYEIVAVRRFTKKDNGVVKPFQTVCITFLSTILPEHVYLDLFRFRVYPYNAPLLQCFKCFKFNHGAKICKSSQKCSICSEEHHYSQCSDDNIIKCINCQGPHLAISRDCPVKKMKIEDKKNKSTYANALKKTENNLTKNYQLNFPQLQTPKSTVKSSLQKKAPVFASATPTPSPTNFATLTTYDESKTIPKLTNEKIIDEIINNDFIRKAIVGALVTIGNEERAITSSVIQEILIKALKPNK